MRALKGKNKNTGKHAGLGQGWRAPVVPDHHDGAAGAPFGHRAEEAQQAERLLAPDRTRSLAFRWTADNSS